MDGIEKIAGRIAADTEAEIAAIRVEARRQADEITVHYEAQAQREAEGIAARGCHSAEERQARLASVARLDARKLELAAKQEMLAKAYDRAMERLTSLPDGEYVGLLAGLAAEASSTGREEVVLSQKGRTRYSKQVVTQTSEELRDGHLTLSTQTRPIRSGLILSDGDVEMNCTFETLIRLLRGEMNRAAVEVLFGWALRQGGENLSKTRDTDYLTISAHVRAMENRLATRERIERMVEARSDDEAVEVLTECGYEELPALTNRRLDELLSAVRAALYRELGGAVPDKRLAELFQMKYDYRNAKALVKGAAVGADVDRLLMKGGRQSTAQVKEAFQRDSLWEFTGPFRRAVVQARETLNGGSDPQLADLVLGRVYFAEMVETVHTVGSSFLEGYVWLLIDAANLRSAVRCARMGEGSDFLSQVLLPGGNVETHVLMPGKGNDLAAAFRAGLLSDAAAAGTAPTAPDNGEFTALERLYDNAMMGYLAQVRRIPFGEQTVVGYLYAQEAEFTAIRTIPSGRMAGLDADTIRERLRETYV